MAWSQFISGARWSVRVFHSYIIIITATATTTTTTIIATIVSIIINSRIVMRQLINCQYYNIIRCNIPQYIVLKCV